MATAGEVEEAAARGRRCIDDGRPRRRPAGRPAGRTLRRHGPRTGCWPRPARTFLLNDMDEELVDAPGAPTARGTSRPHADRPAAVGPVGRRDHSDSRRRAAPTEVERIHQSRVALPPHPLQPPHLPTAARPGLGHLAPGRAGLVRRSPRPGAGPPHPLRHRHPAGPRGPRSRCRRPAGLGGGDARWPPPWPRWPPSGAGPAASTSTSRCWCCGTVPTSRPRPQSRPRRSSPPCSTGPGTTCGARPARPASTAPTPTSTSCASGSRTSATAARRWPWSRGDRPGRRPGPPRPCRPSSATCTTPASRSTGSRSWPTSTPICADR